jgi:hypothetical protein
VTAWDASACPAGYTDINDSSECQQAAEEETNQEFEKTFSYDTIPYGCIIDETGGAYFNTHHGGRAHHTVAIICKAVTTAASYTDYDNKNTFTNFGSTNIGSRIDGLSQSECEQICTDDSACDCVVYKAAAQYCWKRSACDPEKFKSSSDYAVYVKNTQAASKCPSDCTGCWNDVYNRDKCVSIDFVHQAKCEDYSGTWCGK